MAVTPDAISAIYKLDRGRLWETIWPADPFNVRRVLAQSTRRKFQSLAHSLPDSPFRDSNTPRRARAGQSDFQIRHYVPEAHVRCPFIYPVTVYINAFLRALRFPSLRVSLTLRPAERYRSFLAFPSTRSAYVSPISPEEPRRNAEERPCRSSRIVDAPRITVEDRNLEMIDNFFFTDNLKKLQIFF